MSDFYQHPVANITCHLITKTIKHVLLDEGKNVNFQKKPMDMRAVKKETCFPWTLPEVVCKVLNFPTI